MAGIKVLLAISLAGSLTLVHVEEAPAQGGVLSKCAKAIWEFVGRPLVAGTASKSGELIAGHLAEKSNRGQAPTITDDDIRQLRNAYERRGRTECELRGDLESLYGSSMHSPPLGYSARADCGRTGAYGIAQGEPTPRDALWMAVHMCIQYGGIPECCQKGAYLTQ